MSAKCFNESSTAASCNKNNLDMEYKQTLDGMFTVRVTGLKEQFRNWSPVYIKAEIEGLSSDRLCVYIYNESAAGKITSVKYDWPQSKEQGGGRKFQGAQPNKISLPKISLAQHKIGLENIPFHNLFNYRFIKYVVLNHLQIKGGLLQL